jgi:predicted TIM-barrel fold metal-dependent hydrolase
MLCGFQLLCLYLFNMLTNLKLKASLYIDQYMVRAYITTGPRFLSGQSQSQSQSQSQMQTQTTAAAEQNLFPRKPSSLKGEIPRGSWDSHMHVLEPGRYPLSSDARYAPRTYTLAHAQTFEESLGMENVVLVQPSIYAFDNTCLLAALKKIGPSRGRGVVVIDPGSIQPEMLAQWHALGVRGVRVNLKSVNRMMTEDELVKTLRQHADVIRPLGWAIQVYASLDMMPALERCVSQLGVKVCIDHFGSPDLSSVKADEDGSFDPYTLPGFSSLVALLRAGQTYVKLSAPYRLSRDPQMRDIRVLTQELLQVARTRVIYATDWPHTRFEGLDIQPFTEMCLQLCGEDRGLTERLFRENARDLWDAQG